MATLTGYEFYIITPAEATNEVLNPSLEMNATGYDIVGSGVTIARVSTQQRRGLWSLEVATATGVASGVCYRTVNEDIGVTRTFSVDVYNPTPGQAMRIYIADSGGAALATTTFTSNGYWQRISVTRTGTENSATRGLFVMRDAVASTAKFYVDGFYYSTVNGTYLDGDMKGFIQGAAEYRWYGTPHASRSWRSGQSRSGGTMLRIKDYAMILTVLGLGMAAVTNIAVPTASGHSIYQDTTTGDREFILNLAITGATLGDKQANRNALINAVRPDLVTPKQPLLIRYQGTDATGGDASEPVDIYAHYVDGLGNEADNPAAEFVPLRFVQYLPFVSKSGDSGAGLSYNNSIAGFANIGYRDTDGTWKAMGTGVTGGAVNAILPAPDGSVYVGGAFTSAGGVATTANIARWNGTAWSSLPTGLNGAVHALEMGPDGKLYVGGDFTATIGGTTLNRLGVWDGANWTALGTGLNGRVRALAFGFDGSLYVGGDFTQAGGIAAYKFAKWDGSAWSSVGGITNITAVEKVYAVAVGPDGLIYVGGAFVGTTGYALSNGIAKYDPVANTWGHFGNGVDTGVYAITFGADGALIIGGPFSTTFGGTSSHIARWNGTRFESLGAGITGYQKSVYGMAVGMDGAIYAGGDFSTAGGVTMPDHDAVWSGGVWLPLDIKIQDAAAVINTFAFDSFGRLYMGGGWTGSTALSAIVTVTSTGNTGKGTSPVITFTGPGTIWQIKNYTTGQAIYLGGVTLPAGASISLDLRSGRVGIVGTANNSSLFQAMIAKNFLAHIMVGSTLDWYLRPGTNNVSVFMTGTTAASGVVMVWQDSYWSIDGAKR